jgi:HlyD family secretion protein
MNPSALPLLRRGVRWLKIVLPLLAAAAFIKLVVLRPVAVAVFETKPGTVVSEVMGTGTLAARVKVTLSPKIQGRLAAVLVDQNDRIHAGQVLARLDDGEWLQQVEIARAALAAARATVDRLHADQSRAEAVVRLARLDHQRSRELLATRAVSQADFDRALQSLHVAEADLQRTQLAIAEAELQAVAAGKNLLYQQERLADTRLASPFDGLVVKRNRDAGEVVVPGSAVLEIIDTSEIWVSAWVDESAMAGLAPGQPARVVFRSEPDRTYRGEVARLGRQTDPETREFMVDVRVPALPANWTIGQRAEVYIATAQAAAAATVPVHAVFRQEDQPGVFVAEHGTAHWRPVELGLRGRDRVEIISGIAPGDLVAASRNPRVALVSGKRVRVP